jgi:hypothetical protein
MSILFDCKTDRAFSIFLSFKTYKSENNYPCIVEIFNNVFIYERFESNEIISFSANVF